MLRDLLRPGERHELQNVMRNEPVHPGDTVSHATAKSLSEKGLIRRQGVCWVACWDRIARGEVLTSWDEFWEGNTVDGGSESNQ